MKEISTKVVPEIRACPKCFSLFEHKEGCKYFMCGNQSCKLEFCFCCIQPWTAHPDGRDCMVAPRQKLPETERGIKNNF